jgi:putative SOS response-associated peptidase YedK
VLAHGFFEWQHVSGAKIPWYIKLRDDRPFAFAGLSDSWTDPETGEIMRTISIITTAANPLMEKIHNSKKRMPVILPDGNEDKWINPSLAGKEAMQLLLPLDQDLMHAHTISQAINDRNTQPDDPAVIDPYEHPSTGTLF